MIILKAENGYFEVEADYSNSGLMLYSNEWHHRVMRVASEGDALLAALSGKYVEFRGVSVMVGGSLYCHPKLEGME